MQSYHLNMAKEGRKRTVRNRKVDPKKEWKPQRNESRDDNVVKKD